MAKCTRSPVGSLWKRFDEVTRRATRNGRVMHNSPSFWPYSMSASLPQQGNSVGPIDIGSSENSGMLHDFAPALVGARSILEKTAILPANVIHIQDGSWVEHLEHSVKI